MEMKLSGCLYNYCLTCIISFHVNHEFLWIRPIWFVVLLLGKLYEYLVTQFHAAVDRHWLSDLPC